jgi:hypothetical protein
MRALEDHEMTLVAGGSAVDPIYVTMQRPDPGPGPAFDHGGQANPPIDPRSMQEFIPISSHTGLSPEDINAATELVKALNNIKWNQLGIDANEKLLGFSHGYKDAPINIQNMIEVAKIGNTRLFSQGDLDRDDKGNYRYYGDRDGDGIIDTGILYNPITGTIGADFDCKDGAEQYLGNAYSVHT